VYSGKQIPRGKKGMTFSCLYRANDRTLTSEEAEPAHRQVLSILQNDFLAQQR
jgi:phenylalanyl-tRNA synthetase beta chain